MKHLFLSLFFALNLLPVFSQSICKVSFTYGEDAKFVNSQGDKDYVVFQCPGYSAESLFDKVMYHINLSNFLTDSNVFGSKFQEKHMENERITVETVIVNAYYEKVMGVNFSKHLKCKFGFRFKDGKIRIDAPIIKRVITDHPIKKGTKESISSSSFTDTVKMFYKDGKLKEGKERLYECIKKVVNDSLNEFISKSFAPKVEENW